MKTHSLIRIVLSSAVTFAAAMVLSPAALADDSALNGKDKSFLNDAYQGGLAEVQSAQMAQQKTGNADVKAFAEKLAADHGKANSELKALADAKKVSLADDASLAAKSKSKLLDMKSGGDFDKAWIDAQISDHKKDI